jgi:hypothetical protein
MPSAMARRDPSVSAETYVDLHNRARSPACLVMVDATTRAKQDQSVSK